MTKKISFRQTVSELVALRAYIPEDRRALSGVRHPVRLDVLASPAEPAAPPKRRRAG